MFVSHTYCGNQIKRGRKTVSTNNLAHEEALTGGVGGEIAYDSGNQVIIEFTMKLQHSKVRLSQIN